MMHNLNRWTSAAALLGVLVVSQPPSTTPTLVQEAAITTTGSQLQTAHRMGEPAVYPHAARGGRGAEHCALAVGVFVGGALGFFANPFVGTSFMRLGFMAAALHCT